VTEFKAEEVVAYFKALEAELLDPNRRTAFGFAAEFRESVPEAGGVYVFFHQGRVVYVGETTSLRQRLAVHMRNPENHVLALKIARLLYDKLNGSGSAGSARKFLESHKEATRQWAASNLHVAFADMAIGRKELEERLVAHHAPLFNARYPELP